MLVAQVPPKYLLLKALGKRWERCAHVLSTPVGRAVATAASSIESALGELMGNVVGEIIQFVALNYRLHKAIENWRMKQTMLKYNVCGCPCGQLYKGIGATPVQI